MQFSSLYMRTSAPIVEQIIRPEYSRYANIVMRGNVVKAADLRQLKNVRNGLEYLYIYTPKRSRPDGT